MAHNRMITRYKRQSSVMLDHETYNWLVAEAKRLGISQSEIIRTSLGILRRTQELTKAA